MAGQGRPIAVAIVFGIYWVAGIAQAQTPVEIQPTLVAPRTATPLEDDANLHDVQFVGSKIGWAVGDRGVIWKSVDGGTTWNLIPSGVNCPLRSICFLTDRVGWIVGGGVKPYSKIGYGVLLFTRDGGQSWQNLSTGQLPPLQYVKFFGMEQGVAIGQSTIKHSTGVLFTDDGGNTWLDMPGPSAGDWRTAQFLSPEVGVVAGTSGKAFLVGGGRLLQPRIASNGSRGFRSVFLKKENGWLVGDGGLILQTENGGVVWQEPAGRLPEGLRESFDFRAVTARGQQVWVAGNPGSVIWYSADAGQKWYQQFTGQTVPLNAMHFSSDLSGWAVGELGGMIKTEDGGRTWKNLRATNRRVALMNLVSSPADISANLLVKQSGELGYRSLVHSPIRFLKTSTETTDQIQPDRKVQEAVLLAGGNSSVSGWQVAADLPEIEGNYQKLVEHWNRQTEGKLAEVFVGTLVRELRTWRPDVLVLNAPDPKNAASKVLYDATLQAVKQAADATRLLSQIELTGLNPWKVKKVYLKLPAGSTGQTNIDPHEFLNRVGTSTQVAAAKANSLLSEITDTTTGKEAYRLIDPATEETISDASAGRFFANISISPGSAARRKLLPFDERQHEIRKKLAKRHRNIQAYTKKFLDDQRYAAQLVGNLSEITSGLPDDQAALQLWQIAAEYRVHSEFDLAEATLVELVHLYPTTPVASQAMKWLFQFWSSAETAWQRSREVTVGKSKLVTDAKSVEDRIRKAIRLATTDPDERDISQVEFIAKQPTLDEQIGRLRISPGSDWRRGAVKNWNQQAIRLAKLLQKTQPNVYASPEIQFPLASVLRNRDSNTLADSLYRRFQSNNANDSWSAIAGSELWMTNPVELPPRPIVVCYKTNVRPNLDGVLSDDCWQNATEIRLTGVTSRQSASSAIAFFAYDENYFYYAASIPRHPELPKDQPVEEGRKHDADLSGFDRLALMLDVDRDYATHYSVNIDQRGKVSESCWNDAKWNPRMFVATAADDLRWRIEVAIPFSELVPAAPERNDVWAIGLTRILPAIGLESWTHPVSYPVGPESFGLVKFD